MKAHKYWSIGAVITMFGTFYTGYRGLKEAHKYFAFGSLICMIMSVYTGHKMISGKKKAKKQAEAKEASKKLKGSKRKTPKRQERNNINREETQISLPKSASLFLFPRRPFFPTHPLPYVLPRTAPIPCVLSSFYVQYRKYKPIIQATGSSMKLEKSGQRAKMDTSIKSI